MKIVSVAQMRELEAAAVAAGFSEAQLMEEAGRGVAQWLGFLYPDAPAFFFVCGKGNNGGDGIVAARALAAAGRKARCFSPFALAAEGVEPLAQLPRDAGEGAVLVDALLGIGASGALRADVRAAAQAAFGGARRPVVALDVPTGVDADTGRVAEGAVRADATVTCGLPKAGLFAATAQGHVGRVRVAPLPVPDAAIAALGETPEFFDDAEARRLLPRRAWDAHKGDFGRVRVVAGSEGMSGAAVMAIEGALHAGAGLVSAFVPAAVHEIVASRVPEAMVRPFENFDECLPGRDHTDVFVVGPGLGVSEAGVKFLARLARQEGLRMVLDADALNMLASSKPLLQQMHAEILLTPHPGEMKRLFGLKDFDRFEACRKFSVTHRMALLLKGASSVVCQSERPLSVNSTGNPGMATGGMGDVLAGICGGLMAQGIGAYDAGRLGAFVHGLAGDIALQEQSVESLLPRHVLAHLGGAFRMLR